MQSNPLEDLTEKTGERGQVIFFPKQVLFYEMEDCQGISVCVRFPVTEKMMNDTDRIAAVAEMMYGEKTESYVVVQHEDQLGFHLIDVETDLVAFTLRRV